MASPSVRRPSASVLLISTVLPDIDLSTSPSLYDLPDGMFLVQAASAGTSYGTPRSASTPMALMTAAAPDMSIFISSIALDGLSDRPPESNVTPLPTSAIFFFDGVLPFGFYARGMKRGSSSLPWETARYMPMPSFWHSFGPSTLSSRP